ncbi:surface-adhesin E family protein [Chryseobacterium gambrini]|uniref:surface-adhesin E family protein n=1 Tax=Chryseobacterium gambrini TaxID=373672 RepID=UPI0022F3A5F1|nr:surface-adhesin E family protein [Chryseobacterium gambrini]WBX98369.1 hypothetical protein PE065_03710 [Chryseobacterium gambrini]
MKKPLLILILFPTSFFAQSEWKFVGADSEDARYYIKDTSKKSYSEDITFWVKIDDADKVVKTKKGRITKKGTSTKQFWKANCNEKTIEIISITKYSSTGKVLWSDSFPSLPKPVVPDSIGEAVFYEGCTYISN